MSLRTLILVLVGLLLAGPILAKERTWTCADGTQIKAEFIREIDGEVTFLQDGKLVTMPLDKLNQKDQQIVRDLTMGKPVPDDEGAAPAASGTGSPAARGETKKPSTPKITIENRTWTDDRGNKTTAKFVRINGNDVVLSRSGRILTISYHSLSEEDQQYIQDVLTQQGKEDLIPTQRTAPAVPNGTNSVAGDGVAGGAASATGPSTIPGSPFPGGSGPGPSGIGGPRFGPRSGQTPGVPVGVPRPPGIGSSGIPGGEMGPGGFPGGGIGPGGIGPGGGMPLPPAGTPGGPAFGPMGTPDGLGGPTSTPFPPSGFGGAGSFPSRSGITPGFGSGMGGSGGTSFPTAPQIPDVPPIGAMPGSSFAPQPNFQQVFQCSGCKRQISEAQSKLDKCPYCGTWWVYKEDGTGNKKYSGLGGSGSQVVNFAVGIIVVIVVVVLAAVGGFIGIIAAIVRAATRPAPRTNYRRW
jgi:DNA-directed RNA polymerase subunit RPC12/RpoP